MSKMNTICALALYRAVLFILCMAPVAFPVRTVTRCTPYDCLMFFSVVFSLELQVNIPSVRLPSTRIYVACTVCSFTFGTALHSPYQIWTVFPLPARSPIAFRWRFIWGGRPFGRLGFWAPSTYSLNPTSGSVPVGFA